MYNDLKFLIVLVYYERPQLVLNALQSLNELQYDNYEVVFIDDGSINKGEPIVREQCPNIIDKFEFVYIENTIEEKQRQGGSIHGKYMNQAIRGSNADIFLVLCDDDALVSDYLINLNKYYNENPHEQWAYCHLMYYNPNVENYKEAVYDRSQYKHQDVEPGVLHNRNTGPICPAYNVDSSQVSFRREVFERNGIWYPHPQTGACDLSVFIPLHHALGDCRYIGSIGQYKGWFDGQLGHLMRSGQQKY